MNGCFLNALNGRNQEGPPVWLMRQAGRHLASYRSLRERYSFLELCHEPDLITEVTLLPIHAYGMDAAILFSDILVIPEAMGLGLRFEEQAGPIIERPISNPEDVYALPSSDLSKLQYVAKGIKQLLPQLKVPLIGFCGAPFTVASYMIEGKSSRDLKKTKAFMFQHPKAFHALLKVIADWTIAYLRLQAKAGVDAIQIFDSWANFLAHHQFREFSLAYLKLILHELHSLNIPMILFCRGSSIFASQLAELNPAGIGLDWNCHLAQIRQQIPSSIALQGNLDPDLLSAPISNIKKEVERLLEDMSGDSAFILNLGHGVLPHTSEEAVKTLVECVKKRR